MEYWFGGGTLSTWEFRKLERLQNRIVYNLFSHNDESINEVSNIYSRNKILKIPDVYRLYGCIAIYKILNCGYLSFYMDTLISLAFNHNYLTRHRNDYRVPVPRSRAIKLNLIYQALKSWNSLSLDVRNSTSVNIFKRKLRDHIFSQY